jgi:hypothetical protein
MDAKTRQLFQRLLAAPGDAAHPAPRLSDDARRLWGRVQKLASMNLASIADETDAVELACYALQLPMRQRKLLSVGRLGRTSLKDRSEQSAELLVSQLGNELDEDLLDHTTRLLRELPHRSPMLDAAKLLADAVNLEDFGIAGLLNLSLQLGRQGDGLAQLTQAYEKRVQYGYWDARLRDGFHFEPVRRIARRRLDRARQLIQDLIDELAEDAP